MPRRFSRALSVMVVALLGGLYGQISPASGAPANDSSTFMAGYVLDPAPGAVSAAVHFTLPALTCPSTGSVLLGAMAFAPDGTRTGGEMLGYCSGLEGSGPAYWVAVFQFNGSALQVKFGSVAGDTIVVHVSESASGGKVWIKDATLKKGQTAITNGATNAFVNVGVVSDDDGEAPTPLAPFSNVPFWNARVDGTSLSAASAVAYDMKTSSGITQVHTGTLNSTGRRFTEIFEHS